MKKWALFAAVLAMAGMISMLAFNTSHARTTRDLVFEDDEETTASTKKNTEQHSAGTQSMAIKTTILLTREGKTSTVLPTHEFKSGDRVKLVYTPSIDGFVYWMAKGSSGAHAVLFPSQKAGMDNAVKRNQEYTIPIKGTFRFDDTPGKEELLCILSPTKLPDLEKAITKAKKQTLDEAGTTELAALEEKNTSNRKTRDLVFEEDDQGDVNTKKQTAPKGDPMVAHFVLTHK